MTDSNAIDTTEYGQWKQVHSENGIRSPSLIGSSKDQGQVGTGNSPKGVSEKRENEGGVLQSTKKQRKS